VTPNLYRGGVPADSILYGLDAEQREAVTTAAGPLAIIAAAGSGKTTVLTRRIAYRVAEGSAMSQHVLALTFTRDAAAELKRRLRKLDIREPIEAGTFHGVALRLLRDRALAANQAPPQVANDRLRLAREVMATRGLAGAAFNAAKEVALDHFIAGDLGFMQMAAVVEATLNRVSSDYSLGNAALSLEDVLQMDHLARVRAAEAVIFVKGS